MSSLLLLILLSLTTTLVISCNPQILSTSFDSCLQLLTLSAILRYSYDPSKMTLSTAFTAPPPASFPQGWVAWGINPTEKYMPGTQALIGGMLESGTVVANTYNISSYTAIIPAPLSFPVQNLKAEFNAGEGTITIYSSLLITSNNATLPLTILWQVGIMSNGIPTIHAFRPENLLSIGLLDYAARPVPSPQPSPPSSPDRGTDESPKTSPKVWKLPIMIATPILGVILVGGVVLVLIGRRNHAECEIPSCASKIVEMAKVMVLVTSKK